MDQGTSGTSAIQLTIVADDKIDATENAGPASYTIN